jgi:hypothetical protein
VLMLVTSQLSLGVCVWWEFHGTNYWVEFITYI